MTAIPKAAATINTGPRITHTRGSLELCRLSLGCVWPVFGTDGGDGDVVWKVVNAGLELEVGFTVLPGVAEMVGEGPT